MLSFGSVCSGIEAASVAWHPLGWRAAWLAEIEPFPSAVLAHHYPEVPNLGDMTALPDRIRLGEVEAPDVFCGGTPCQAFSVAGLRRSLDDARGNLSLTFCEIAHAIDDVRRTRGEQPAVIFWENVPGVLSTKDNAFGCFLAGLAGEDEPLVAPGGKWTDAGVVLGPARAVAWRVLNAEHFGLAQRRKRVFVVASARDGFDPAAVLFEFDGVRRDSAPSREAGKVAPTIPSRSTAGGDLGTDFDCDGGVIQQTWCIKGAAIGRKPEAGPQHGEVLADVAYTQNCVDQHAVVSLCLNAVGQHRLDAESETLIPTIGGGFDGPVGVTLHGTDGTASVASLTELSSSLRARIPSGVENSTTTAVLQPVVQPVTYDFFNITAPVNRQSREPGDPCHTLARSNAEHAVVMQPVAFRETADCLTAAYGTKWNGNASADNGSLFAAQPVAFAQNQRNEVRTMDVAGALAAEPGAKQQTYLAQPVALQDVRAMNKSQNGRGWNDDGTAYTVDTHATQGVAVAFQPGNLARGAGSAPSAEVFPTLKSDHGRGASDQQPHVMTAMQVRRLTPVECERLQGFPDGYTAIPWRKKPASECPDGPRYKALGNSWAVPVVRWIGRRIARAIA